MTTLPEVLELSDTFRSIVQELDPRLDPFEALADYVVNEKYGGTDERSGAIQGND